jgi:hypothetical protein
MRLAKVLSVFGFLIMGFMILRAIVVGDFNGEGASLIRGPWASSHWLMCILVSSFLQGGSSTASNRGCDPWYG